MVESNQSKESGFDWFAKLQAEISAAPAESLEQFRAVVNPDAMGFEGKEGIDDDWYFEDTTVQTAIQLTRELMQKYGINSEHVIRHYDVTGKICPNPFVCNHTPHTGEAFKAAPETTPATYQEGFVRAADGRRWWYQYKMAPLQKPAGTG